MDIKITAANTSAQSQVNNTSALDTPSKSCGGPSHNLRAVESGRDHINADHRGCMLFGGSSCHLGEVVQP